MILTAIFSDGLQTRNVVCEALQQGGGFGGVLYGVAAVLSAVVAAQVAVHHVGAEFGVELHAPGVFAQAEGVVCFVRVAAQQNGLQR